MKTRRTEQGQALVLIILAITAIFGFAALAVDFGRIYSERRRAQNAADAAALAAAQAAARRITEEDVTDIAMDSANLNGFDNNAETNWVTYNHPPVSGPYGPASGLPLKVRNLYYQVTITQHVNPIFSQLIYGGNEQVTVEAISQIEDYASVSSGDAIHSLSSSSDSLELLGAVGVKVHNGNIVSNGGGKKGGASGEVRVENGDINISNPAFDCKGCKTDTLQPAPNTDVGATYPFSVPEPYCPTKNETWDGVHYYAHTGGLGAGNLQPGIHCVWGDIDLSGQNSLTGTDVLIVLLNGGIKIKGGATLNLTRASSLIDKNGNQYGGMLIYALPGNDSTLTLGGNTGSVFHGTILAPDGTCDMGGTAQGQASHTAIICDNVKFHGTTDVNIIYREAELFRFPARVNLSQ